MTGVSQFACVMLYGFHSSFLIVCFPYTEDYPRSQHMVVSPTVCSMHCSCATNVHLIPESGDDEESIVCPCRERGYVQVVLCASFCLNMVLATIRSNSVHSAIDARCWNYISRSHICQILRATCHFLFLSLH